MVLSLPKWRRVMDFECQVDNKPLWVQGVPRLSCKTRFVVKKKKTRFMKRMSKFMSCQLDSFSFPSVLVRPAPFRLLYCRHWLGNPTQHIQKIRFTILWSLYSILMQIVFALWCSSVTGPVKNSEILYGITITQNLSTDNYLMSYFYSILHCQRREQRFLCFLFFNN